MRGQEKGQYEKNRYSAVCGRCCDGSILRAVLSGDTAGAGGDTPYGPDELQVCAGSGFYDNSEGIRRHTYQL